MLSDKVPKRAHMDKVEELLKWIEENDVAGNPNLMSKLYDEARRRWPALITRRINEIVEDTLRKME